MQERLPEGTQTHFRSIVTDQFCRVLGSSGSIYAVGDAATIQQVTHRTHRLLLPRVNLCITRTRRSPKGQCQAPQRSKIGRLYCITRA